LVAEEDAMPRYYFNVIDGKNIVDDEGVELPDAATAKKEAVRLAGFCIAELAETFWDLRQEWRLHVVTDAEL
jgi:hypothetical protein